MPKNWIAFGIGANGGASNTTSGFLDTQLQAEEWATKFMAKNSVESVAIAKVHSKAVRPVPELQFVGVSDVEEVHTDHLITKMKAA